MFAEVYILPVKFMSFSMKKERTRFVIVILEIGLQNESLSFEINIFAFTFGLKNVSKL
jgi:hypothetical protein